MTGPDVRLASALETMRRSFDESFATPQRSERAEAEEFLGLSIAGDPFALRTRAISGIEAGLRIVALPVKTSELLGIAGIRGRLIPIYSLALLLGYTAPVAEERWVILAGAEPPLGFAFSEFEGFLRVPQEAGARGEGRGARSGPSALAPVETVQVEGVIRHVLPVPSLIEATKARAWHGTRPGEEDS